MATHGLPFLRKHHMICLNFESQKWIFWKMTFWKLKLHKYEKWYSTHKNDNLGTFWSVFEARKHISSIFWAQNWKKLKFSPSLLIFMLYTAILASQAFVKCCLAGWKWHAVTLGGLSKNWSFQQLQNFFWKHFGSCITTY